jgi:hypothetical protein
MRAKLDDTSHPVYPISVVLAKSHYPPLREVHLTMQGLRISGSVF